MPPKDTAADAATDLTQTSDAAGADNGGAGDASNDAPVQTPTPQPDPAPAPTAVAPAGYPTVSFKAPEGVTSISWAGTGYDVAEDGTVAVPFMAATDLLAHGFVEVE